MENLNIRTATKKDIPFILEIVNESILNTTANYNYDILTLAQQMAWFEKQIVDAMPVIVSVLEGIVCGYGSYNRFHEKIGYQFTVEHSIYLSTKMRGTGIGSLLMKELILLARKQNLHIMIGLIDGENQGSIDFHKKFGFVEVGRMKEVGFKFKSWVDLVFMQLTL